MAEYVRAHRLISWVCTTIYCENETDVIIEADITAHLVQHSESIWIGFPAQLSPSPPPLSPIYCCCLFTVEPWFDIISSKFSQKSTHYIIALLSQPHPPIRIKRSCRNVVYFCICNEYLFVCLLVCRIRVNRLFSERKLILVCVCARQTCCAVPFRTHHKRLFIARKQFNFFVHLIIFARTHKHTHKPPIHFSCFLNSDHAKLETAIISCHFQYVQKIFYRSIRLK